MEVMTVVHDETTINQENDFRYGIGASLRRITPSAQVGRLSGSHSDIGFQLAASSIPRKMAMERKGERVSALVWF